MQVHVVKFYNQSGDSSIITASDAKIGTWKENIWFKVYLTGELLP